MADVFLDIVRVDDNVVYVDETRLPLELGEDHVECTLITCRCVCKTKLHSYVLIRAFIANKRGLVSIFRGDLDLAVPIVGVQGCKDFGFSKQFDTLVHSWQGVGFLYCHRVGFSVLNTESQTSIFPRPEKDGLSHLET